MRIIFVRHGHPNYEKDCLTDLGHLQAQAAAERLKDEGITQIHASSCGRARETAEHTAQLLSLPVTQHDFMREIWWGSADGEPIAHGGQPWMIAEDMVAAQQSLLDSGWGESLPFSRNIATPNVRMIAEKLDAFLLTLGYAREGLYYRVRGSAGGTIAIFSHGGSSSAMLSHLFNLPFPFVCSAMPPDFTAVTILRLPDEEGVLASPNFELLGDARHIRGVTTENLFGR